MPPRVLRGTYDERILVSPYGLADEVVAAVFLDGQGDSHICGNTINRNCGQLQAGSI